MKTSVYRPGTDSWISTHYASDTIATGRYAKRDDQICNGINILDIGTGNRPRTRDTGQDMVQRIESRLKGQVLVLVTEKGTRHNIWS